MSYSDMSVKRAGRPASPPQVSMLDIDLEIPPKVALRQPGITANSSAGIKTQA